MERVSHFVSRNIFILVIKKKIEMSGVFDYLDNMHLQKYTEWKWVNIYKLYLV